MFESEIFGNEIRVSVNCFVRFLLIRSYFSFCFQRVLNSSQFILWFDLAWFYGISTLVGYLMPNHLYTHISNIYDLTRIYGISTMVGYLIPNILYTYKLAAPSRGRPEGFFFNSFYTEV